MATLNSNGSPSLSTQSQRASTGERTTDAELYQCLIVAPLEQRRRMIRTAAEAQHWKAVVCGDAADFMRWVFRKKVALIVVDLDHPNASERSFQRIYDELRQAVENSARVSDALLLISGNSAQADEEIWARGLGVWSYLPNADSRQGLEHVLRDAHDAVARRVKHHRV